MPELNIILSQACIHFQVCEEITELSNLQQMKQLEFINHSLVTLNLKDTPPDSHLFLPTRTHKNSLIFVLPDRH